MNEIAPGRIEFGTPGTPMAAPITVNPRQARLALLQAGLLDDVEAAIAALPDGDRQAAQIVWDHSTEIRRDGATLALIANALGLSSEEVDALFAAAATIPPA